MINYNQKFVSTNQGHFFYITSLTPRNKKNVSCNCCQKYCGQVTVRIKRDDGLSKALCVNCAQKVLHFNIPTLAIHRVVAKNETFKTVPLENDMDAEENLKFHINNSVLNFLRKG